MNLTPLQREALTTLATAAETNEMLVDQDHTHVHYQAFASLAKKRLAKPVGAGLWRVTLGGLAYLRNPPPKPRVKKRKGATNADAALDVVKANPGATVGDVIRLTNLPVGSANNALRTLHRRGDVTRERPPGELAFRYWPA